MSGAEESGLWRLSQDRSAHTVRRAIAGFVWRYENAPMRDLLVGPEGLYLLDGLILAAIRLLLRIPRRVGSPASHRSIEPGSSGWMGNLIFLLSWAVGIAILISIYRAFR